MLKRSFVKPLLSNIVFSQKHYRAASNSLDVTGFADLIPRSIRMAGEAHQVYIIHPYIKWGPDKLRNTTPELQLEEGIALVESLPKWKVFGTRIVPLLSFDNRTLFNKGNLEIITNYVRQEQRITSVFINIKSLKLGQIISLEETLGVPVFERYSIIINILKQYAKTKEAKLQLALAEIPFMRSRIKGVGKGESFSENVGLVRETFTEKRLQILFNEEEKIKREISSLQNNRINMRNKRKKLLTPTVAVVGYTNAGKTSLIKRLTNEVKLEPENRLFATLDVTMHAGNLPCGLKILFIDTIGFISDVPKKLFQAFAATFEDVLQADLIIHVQDISHPDRKAQAENVNKMLSELELPKIIANNIITIGNKCDKLDVIDWPDLLPVSCRSGKGLDELMYEVEKRLILTTNMIKIKIKVVSGSEEFNWLYKEATVSDIQTGDDAFVFLTVVIPKVKLDIFKHTFLNKRNKK